MSRRREWRGRSDLLACVGGPMDGQWFYPADWQQRVDASAYMAERMGQTPDPREYRWAALGYQRTEDILTHPDEPDTTTGRVLAWRGQLTTADGDHDRDRDGAVPRRSSSRDGLDGIDELLGPQCDHCGWRRGWHHPRCHGSTEAWS